MYRHFFFKIKKLIITNKTIRKYLSMYCFCSVEKKFVFRFCSIFNNWLIRTFLLLNIILKIFEFSILVTELLKFITFRKMSVDFRWKNTKQKLNLFDSILNFAKLMFDCLKSYSNFGKLISNYTKSISIFSQSFHVYNKNFKKRICLPFVAFIYL